MKKTVQIKKTSKSKPKKESKPTIPLKNQSKSIPKKSSNVKTSLSKEKTKSSNSKASTEKKGTQNGEEKKVSQFKPEQKLEKSTTNAKTVTFPLEKKTNYNVLRTIKAHNDWVQKLLILKNGKVISCSQDHTLKLWDFMTDDISVQKTPIFVYKGHTDSVTDVIQYTNEKMVSISRDKTLKQWNIFKGKEISSYNCIMPFSCLKQISDTKIALGAGDKSIRLFDLSIMDNNIGDENMNLEISVLNGHEEEVICLECYNEINLFSGGSDNKIKVWDLNNKIFLYNLEGHVQGVQCLKLIQNGKKLLSGGYDNVIRVWNWENKIQEFFLEGHTGHIMCIDKIDDETIISGSTDWSLNIWELNKKEIICSLEDHEESVNCCAYLPNGNIVSGSTDQNIKIWG